MYDLCSNKVQEVVGDRLVRGHVLSLLSDYLSDALEDGPIMPTRAAVSGKSLSNSSLDRKV